MIVTARQTMKITMAKKVEHWLLRHMFVQLNNLVNVMIRGIRLNILETNSNKHYRNFDMEAGIL